MPMFWIMLAASPFIGSFLGNVVRRAPREDGLFLGRSHCDHCDRVLTASGSADALRFAEMRGTEISLVILDVHMPEMSGPELGRRLADLHLPAKVLFVSGALPDDDADIALAPLTALSGWIRTRAIRSARSLPRSSTNSTAAPPPMRAKRVL